MTFKELDNKKKMEHIWEYYRWHIIGGIIGIVLLVSLIATMLKPKPPVFAADLIITGKMVVDETKLEETQANFHETMNVGVMTMINDWGKIDQMTMANEQLLMLKFQVKECDVLATSLLKYEKFMAIEDFEAFAALDAIPELQPILEQHQDALIKGVGEDGKEHVYGIQTDTLNGVEGVELKEDYIIAMITQPKDETAAVNLITHLLQ